MPRDIRTRRDLHAFDANGMVLCNPRDREAAHRADAEGIATDDDAAVTCRACLELLHREARDSRHAAGEDACPPMVVQPPPAFIRSRLAKNPADTGGRKPDHGVQRLARQILDCLQFSTALEEIGLEPFAFADVIPGGHSGLFVVEVACLDLGARFDPSEVEAMLDAVRASVRGEIAGAVHRRKAPEIEFRVRMPGTGLG